MATAQHRRGYINYGLSAKLAEWKLSIGLKHVDDVEVLSDSTSANGGTKLCKSRIVVQLLDFRKKSCTQAMKTVSSTLDILMNFDDQDR